MNRKNKIKESEEILIIAERDLEIAKKEYYKAREIIVQTRIINDKAIYKCYQAKRDLENAKKN